jgi:hypothetical protein
VWRVGAREGEMRTLGTQTIADDSIGQVRILASVRHIGLPHADVALNVKFTCEHVHFCRTAHSTRAPLWMFCP